jgi:hypothetical protein
MTMMDSDKNKPRLAKNEEENVEVTMHKIV